MGWIFLSCHSSQTPDSQHVFPLMSTQLMTNPISTLSKSPLYTNPSIHHTDQRPKLINKDLSPRPTPKSRWSTWIRAFVATGGLLKTRKPWLWLDLDLTQTICLRTTTCELDLGFPQQELATPHVDPNAITTTPIELHSIRDEPYRNPNSAIRRAHPPTQQHPSQWLMADG